MLLFQMLLLFTFCRFIVLCCGILFKKNQIHTAVPMGCCRSYVNLQKKYTGNCDTARPQLLKGHQLQSIVCKGSKKHRNPKKNRLEYQLLEMTSFEFFEIV